MPMKILQQEGIADEKIIFVGNVMIDTLLKHKQMASSLDVLAKAWFEAR